MASNMSMAERAEDHALVSVPAEQRQNGHRLALSTVGVATALVILAIAGFTVVLAGFRAGLAAGVTVAILGFFLGWLVGRIAWATGVSNTVSSRFFGLGLRGSSIGAAIFAFMILGFLAVESALLYEGTLLMFGLEDTWTTKIIIYGLLTALWIALAIFGLKVVLHASAALIVVTIVVIFYMIFMTYFVRGADPMDVLNNPGVVPGGFWTKFEAGFGLMGATAGTIALVATDFARYCRTKKDVAILSMAGPITQNIIMLVLGSFVVIGGLPQVIDYLMARNAGMTVAQAGEAAAGFAMGNTGAYFVIIAGWIGFITIYATQAKAQAINAYSGSLALVNIVDSLTGKKPGRAVMVVVGNIIALTMIAAGILPHFANWLAYLGAMTMALCGVMMADFYIVRKQHFDASHKVENWNWAGVITLHIAAGVGMWLLFTGIWSLGFLVSLALAVIIYPILRKLMPMGTGTSYASEAEALDEAH
ncbi:MAG: hypothetical protein Q4G51_01500 [Dermatophilus congolensis]|nr:hypothetical protein [Dermatophilus congolensis]